MSELLFGCGHLHEYFNRRLEQLKQEVFGWGRDYLLNASEADICDYLTAEYSIEAITPRAEEKTIADSRPIEMQGPSRWGDGRMAKVQGQLIVLAIPFDGDAAILQFLPSTASTRSVRADIQQNEIHGTGP
jgi:hypothetical protein